MRRFEVFTGAGRRRDWRPEVKASIVAERYSGLESVSAVARRHGPDPSQLFDWRRLYRQALEGNSVPVATAVELPRFVPVVVEASPARTATPAEKRQRWSRASRIELEIDGVAVKIAFGADKRTITSVIEALKATR